MQRTREDKEKGIVMQSVLDRNNKTHDVLYSETWEEDGIRYDIKQLRIRGIDAYVKPFAGLLTNTMKRGHFVAYLTTDRPIEKGLEDAPVNGGITFDMNSENGNRTIGFDFAHYFNELHEPSLKEIRGELEALRHYLFGETP